MVKGNFPRLMSNAALACVLLTLHIPGGKLNSERIPPRATCVAGQLGLDEDSSCRARCNRLFTRRSRVSLPSVDIVRLSRERHWYAWENFPARQARRGARRRIVFEL